MADAAASHVSATGRLLALLKRVQTARAGGSALELYVRVSGDASKHPRAGLRLLATIYDLIEAARAEVAAHPEIKQSLYYSALNNIDVLLRNTSVTAPDHQVTDALGPLLNALEFCADQMDRSSQEKRIPESELAELVTAAEELATALRESDLPPELRELLSRRAEELRSALVEYHITGAVAAERAVAAAVGSLYQHRAEVLTHRDKKSLIKYFETIVKVDAAVRTLVRWGELAGPMATKLLSDLSSAVS